MNDAIRERLRQTLEARKNEYLNNLKKLIAQDTQVIGHGIDGGKEENGQAFIEKILKEMGASVSREPVTEEIIQRGLSEFSEGNPGHNYTDYKRDNLAGRFKGGKGRSLIFNGHVDTMPAGEISLWETDPWTPTEKSGKIYGLGSADMKGGLMASVMAVKLLQDAGIDLPGDVTILSVVDEEGGGNGSLAAMLAGHRADAAVVCEHTADSLIVAHMGFIFFQVDVSGVALHSGRKWDGVNAIDKAVLLMQALKDLENKWLLKYKHPLLPPPNLNVGVISGGSAGSTVPDLCTFKLCLHYQPNVQTYDSVVKEVTEALLLRSQGDEWLKDNPKLAAVGDKVTDKDITEALERLATQTAEKKEVSRAIKEGDEATIDFVGKDAKGEEIRGASGDGYPITIGSKTFIPGFEEELIGLEKDAKKTFTVTFPKDYHAENMAGTKVEFNVTIKEVKELVKELVKEHWELS